MVDTKEIDTLITLTGGQCPSGPIYVHSGVITPSMYQERKAVRQNKPSWDIHHYRFIHQGKNGHWYGSLKHNPTPLPDVITDDCWHYIETASAKHGEVIGNFRHTLEQRPNHIAESNEKVALFAQASQRAIAEMESIGLLMPCELGACDCIEQDWGLDPDVAPAFDFEALANQFNNADDINAVWSLRDKLLQKRQSSPELSFHLSNAFNELQASARLLPEDDPRRSALAGIAGAVNAVREVA